MLDIISAIRKLCEQEEGFINLFERSSIFRLNRLTEDKKSIDLFEKLFFGKARNNLIELIKDSYEYKKYAKQIIEDLTSDGLSQEEANRALEIFFRSFGYPEYRDQTFNPITEFVSYEKGNFKTIHKGETKDNQEYGIGIRNNFYDGKSCGWDECVWINGRMIGYCHSLDVEFGAFETKKYGFVLNDTYVGKYMTIYEDGEKEYMNGEKLNLE